MSRRSSQSGYRLHTLPAAGYKGPVPDFPLPAPTARELEVWAELWRLPQGEMWAAPGTRWLLLPVGLYARQFVKCEATDVGATQLAQLHRLADQVGMTAAGLAVHGYKVAVLEEAPPQPMQSRSLERARQRHLKTLEEYRDL